MDSEKVRRSPFEADAARGLDDAFAIVDDMTPARLQVWHLLLAWRCQTENRIDDAVRCLRRLAARRDVVPLASVEGHIAIACLTATSPLWTGLPEFQRVLAAIGDADKLALVAIILPINNLPPIDWSIDAEALEIALRIANGIEDHPLRHDALNWIASRCAESGLIVEALEVAGRVEQEELRSETLGKVASLLAGVGQVEVALSVIGDIEFEWDRSNALSAIVSVLTRIEQVEEALGIANTMKNEWSRFNALSAIASALARLGDARSSDAFTQALAAANGVEPDVSRFNALSQIASALAILDRRTFSRKSWARPTQARTTGSDL